MPYAIKRFLEVKYTLVYVALIPLVNWAFSWTPTVNLPDGTAWSPFAIVVGLVLVVRDFAQREIGQWIFLPLAIGIALSYVLAPPAIATASAVAFMVSELVDWAFYTFSNRPLSQRVLISSVFAIPVDSTIYLMGASRVVSGIFSVWMLGTMMASKLSGAVFVWWLLRRREQKQLSRA